MNGQLFLQFEGTEPFYNDLPRFLFGVLLARRYNYASFGRTVWCCLFVPVLVSVSIYPFQPLSIYGSEGYSPTKHLLLCFYKCSIISVGIPCRKQKFQVSFAAHGLTSSLAETRYC